MGLCEHCPMGPNARTCGSRGNPDARIVLIGEAPGRDELIKGVPFCGAAGRLLDKALRECGIEAGSHDERFFVTNACRCIPSKEKLAHAVKACHGLLDAELRDTEHTVLILLGNSAIRTVLDDYAVHITAQRGKALETPYGLAIPTYHPAFCLRQPGQYSTFVEDLKYAVSVMNGGEIKSPGQASFEVATPDNIRDLIAKLQQYPLLAADIETSERNPRKDRILCIGFCGQKNEVVIVPDYLLRHLKGLFESNTRFCWHNGKFDTAFLESMGFDVRIDEDTMLQSYALEESGVHGLKPLAAQILGAKNWCIAPSTPVLSADLTWDRADRIREGHNLIAFDQKTLSLKKTRVVSVSHLRSPCYRVITSKGSVVCSANHRWLVATSRTRTQLEWKTTEEIFWRFGADKVKRYGQPTMELRWLAAPWKTDESRDAGYIAGFLDGEGSVFCHGKGYLLSYAQKLGSVLDDVTTMLERRGFSIHNSHPRPNGVVQSQLRGGREEVLRLLGTIRPTRLLDNFETQMMSLKHCTYEGALIEAVWDVGEMDVIAIGTESGTFIANGFLSHNSKDLKKWLDDENPSWESIPEDVMYDYLAQDADNTFQLHQIFNERLDDPREAGPKWAYQHVLLPAANFLRDVERHGAYIDVERVEELRGVLIGTTTELRDEIRLYLSEPEFNPNSWKQVLKSLRRCGIKVKKTDKPTLEPYANRSEFVRLLLAYRADKKQLGTYVEGVLKRMDGTGRVHSTFTLHVAVNGRLSSKDPNMQNLPAGPKGKRIKRVFGAPPGRCVIELDYSQAELRWLAVLSKDEWLRGIYLAGRDLHDEMSLELFGEGFTSEQRRLVKTVNFGIPYGRQAPAIVAAVNAELSRMDPPSELITLERGVEIVEGWKMKVPQAWEYLQRRRKDVIKRGYVISMYGRKRRFPLIPSGEYELNELQNQAANHPISSAASDLTLTASMTMTPWLTAHDAFIFNLVHDSNNIEAPLERAMDIAYHCKRVMEQQPILSFNVDVPFVADVKIGSHWGDAVEVNAENIESILASLPPQIYSPDYQDGWWIEAKHEEEELVNA